MLFISCNKNSADTQPSENTADKAKTTDSVKTVPIDKIITITAVGDMMLGTNYPSNRYLPPNDGKDILAQAAPFLKKGDIVFGNLEGAILTGSGSPKQCNNCHSFKSPDHYVQNFIDAGFNLLSVANNHSGDFGAKGRANTAKILKENNINFAGSLDYPSAVFEKDGIKYGFAAFAPNIGTVSINDLDNAAHIVKNLKKECDIVIISFHGGAEGSNKNRITKTYETYLGENRGNPYQFSRTVIDAGADIVIGQGPHVPRAVDIYKGKFIAYSLGNFATYDRFGLGANCGYAPLLEIKINGKGNFVEGQIHSFLQLGKGIPTIDKKLLAGREIKRLTEMDFPDTKIQIDSDGKISMKK